MTPTPLLPKSTQVCVPVKQLVCPVRQGLGLVPQAAPAAHVTQVPVPLQTWLEPQVVPAASTAESRHTALPVPQSVTPARQGAPGLVVHAAPPLQARHWPFPLQTCPAPQFVPAAVLTPSTQATAVPHWVEPTRQGAPGLVAQLCPDTQLMQAPVRQILSMPHEVPVGASGPSRHDGLPVVQDTTPSLHGPLGLPLHVAPAGQAMHMPCALQTCPPPHDTPASTAVAALEQAGLGEHAVTPRLHGSVFEAQTRPAWQGAHAPPTQRSLGPQVVPSPALAPSTQVAAPLRHAVLPSLQGEPGLVPQVVPSVQEAVQTRPPSASAQEPLAQSPATRQALPSTQAVQLPPQSTSVSPMSLTPLEHAALPSQRPSEHEPPSAQVTPLQPMSTQPPSRQARPDEQSPVAHARGMHSPATQVEYALQLTFTQDVARQVPSTQT